MLLAGETRRRQQKINYNGISFEEKTGYWFTTIGNLNFVFKYNPNQVPDINSNINKLNSYSKKPLYISSENYEATTEISRNLGQIATRISNACFDENCTGDYPIKTCEDNFLIIKKSDSLNITQDQNCVFIEGPYENLTQISDEFLFKALGIK
jgi:hypothetical protein